MRTFMKIALVAFGIATMTSCGEKKTEETAATDSTKTEMAAPADTAAAATVDTAAAPADTTATAPAEAK